MRGLLDFSWDDRADAAVTRWPKRAISAASPWCVAKLSIEGITAAAGLAAFAPSITISKTIAYSITEKISSTHLFPQLINFSERPAADGLTRKREDAFDERHFERG